MERPPSSGTPGGRVVAVRLPTSRPILTYILLGVIIGIFAIQYGYQYVNNTDFEPITPWGALIYRNVLDGEYYRLFTAMFLHADPAHLLFNGIALYSFGRSVEAFFGTTRFAVIYFLGGLSGSVFSLIFTRGISVGASGAIFAIFGAEMIFLFVNRKLLGKRAWEEFRWLIMLAIFNFAIGFTSQAVARGVIIDNWAHIGGFFAGIVLAWFIGPMYRLVVDPGDRERVRVEDAVTRDKFLITASAFAIGLFATILYAVTNMR